MGSKEFLQIGGDAFQPGVDGEEDEHLLVQALAFADQELALLSNFLKTRDRQLMIPVKIDS